MTYYQEMISIVPKVAKPGGVDDWVNHFQVSENLLMRIKNRALAVVAIAMLACNAATAQIVDEVTFNGVMPDVNGVGDLQNYTITNSGAVESLLFFGSITEIDTATFGSEIVFDYNGSGLNGTGVQLTTQNGFTDTIFFQTFVALEDDFGMSGNINAGDNWTFNFLDTFDDGGDGLVDASVDITFQYRDSEPVEEITDLGDFVLDDGFYDRGSAGGPEDHPYTEVNFQVTQDGFYSVESNWDDGTGTGTSFDGFLYLFDEPFDGADDSGNIAFDDDGTNGLANSTIETVFLQQGITYSALLTTFGSQPGITNFQGDLLVGSLTGGSAFIVAIPEPGTGLLLLSITGLAMIRRRRA